MKVLLLIITLTYTKYSFSVNTTQIANSTTADTRNTQNAADLEIRPVVGGEKAQLGFWPWQGLILTGGGRFCGFSLISNKWGVTAAHCVDKCPARDLTLFLGYIDNRELSTAQQFRVATAIIHGEYNPRTLRNDISLIELLGVAEFNPHVHPIQLSGPSDELPGGTPCVITGWGTLNVETMENPQVLQQAVVPILSMDKCQAWINVFSRLRILNSQICAGYEDGGVGTCHGDSGGPLVCFNSLTSKTLLYGITSFAYGCAVAKQPEVFTRVAAFTDWIHEWTGIKADKPEAMKLASASPALCTNFTSTCTLYLIHLLLVIYSSKSM